MAEISTLKLKLTAVEKDHTDFEDKYKDTEVYKDWLRGLDCDKPANIDKLNKYI